MEVLDGEELPISICLTQHRLAHQLGSSLLLLKGPVLDPLVLATTHVIIQLCSLLKAFSTLRSVEESLDIRLDNHKLSFLVKTALFYSSGGRIIDVRYIDGVSLTYGSPRQHIWTFANALDEADPYNDRSRCTCTDSSRPNPPPSFVGNDYFCETGVPPGQSFNHSVFYPNDPLWDGQGCGPTSTCCTFNNPPWFCKQLPQSTNADLEVRLCSHNSARYANTPIELVEIYIK